MADLRLSARLTYDGGHSSNRYEAANPQRLPPAQLQSRMMFTFNQALMVCWLTPQVWHEAALWHETNGAAETAQQLYRKALEVLPGSAALCLAYARFEESVGRLAEARALIEGLVAASPAPLNHIILMRFLRRTDGAAAARAAFAAARKAEGCTWHVYLAAAQLEYQLGGGLGGEGEPASASDADGATVAGRILALAFEKFECDPAFTLHYVRFLGGLNDVTNMRAVLERSLLAPRGALSAELWSAMLDVELRCGGAHFGARLRRASCAIILGESRRHLRGLPF